MTKFKRARSSYVLLVGFLSLIVVGAWLSFQIISALTKTQVTEEQQISILPLDGSIKGEDIQNLDNRRRFSNLELNNVILNREATGSSFLGGQ